MRGDDVIVADENAVALDLRLEMAVADCQASVARWVASRARTSVSFSSAATMRTNAPVIEHQAIAVLELHRHLEVDQHLAACCSVMSLRRRCRPRIEHHDVGGAPGAAGRGE